MKDKDVEKDKGKKMVNNLTENTIHTVMKKAAEDRSIWQTLRRDCHQPAKAQIPSRHFPSDMSLVCRQLVTGELQTWTTGFHGEVLGV